MDSSRSLSAREVFRHAAAGEIASVHFGCPNCGRSYIQMIGSEAAALRRPDFSCVDCGFNLPLDLKVLEARQPVRSCGICGCGEFYLQKDFNRRLGLWMVVGTCLIAVLVMLLVDHLLGLVVLGVLTLIDWFLFRRLKAVSVCYLCNAIYRGFPPNPEHGAFYLGSEEKYKKLRQDWIKGLKV
jgi:predicted RNA-binding Zn-ribbon protein involved in translation (DUF1610 family)